MKYDFSINYFEKNNWIYETKLINLFLKKKPVYDGLSSSVKLIMSLTQIFF